MLQSMKEWSYKLNHNIYFIGITMVILNIGSRYVIQDLSKVQNKILSSWLFKKISLFAMFFVATKNVVISFLLMTGYVLLVNVLFNDQSQFCVLPQSFKDMDLDNDGKLSAAELKIAYEKQLQLEKEQSQQKKNKSQ